VVLLLAVQRVNCLISLASCYSTSSLLEQTMVADLSTRRRAPAGVTLFTLLPLCLHRLLGVKGTSRRALLLPLGIIKAREEGWRGTCQAETCCRFPRISGGASVQAVQRMPSSIRMQAALLFSLWLREDFRCVPCSCTIVRTRYVATANSNRLLDSEADEIDSMRARLKVSRPAAHQQEQGGKAHACDFTCAMCGISGSLPVNSVSQ
jgi:hypothetical protein